MLTGCAITGAPYGGGSPVGGWVYTDAKAPAQQLNAPVDATAKPMKCGKATCTSILGIVGVGDASIDAAMKDAGITKIHHIDHHVTNILGLYATWTVMVYGE